MDLNKSVCSASKKQKRLKELHYCCNLIGNGMKKRILSIALLLTATVFTGVMFAQQKQTTAGKPVSTDSKKVISKEIGKTDSVVRVRQERPGFQERRGLQAGPGIQQRPGMPQGFGNQQGRMGNPRNGFGNRQQRFGNQQRIGNQQGFGGVRGQVSNAPRGFGNQQRGVGATQRGFAGAQRGNAPQMRNAAPQRGQVPLGNRQGMERFGGSMDPEKRIDREVEAMTKKLNLSEDQAKKIKNIKMKYAKKEIKAYKKQQKKLDALKKKREAPMKEIKSVLDEEQLKKLEAGEIERPFTDEELS